MTDNKKFRTVSLPIDTVLKVDQIRQELVDKARTNGDLGADKISLADIIVVAVDFWDKRRNLEQVK